LIGDAFSFLLRLLARRRELARARCNLISACLAIGHLCISSNWA